MTTLKIRLDYKPICSRDTTYEKHIHVHRKKDKNHKMLNAITAGERGLQVAFLFCLHLFSNLSSYY